MQFAYAMSWMGYMDPDRWLALVPVAPSAQEDRLTAKVQELYQKEAEVLALLEPEDWVCD
jgi:hypothetical protein